jgi:hypothetical protein
MEAMCFPTRWYPGEIRISDECNLAHCYQNLITVFVTPALSQGNIRVKMQLTVQMRTSCVEAIGYRETGALQPTPSFSDRPED